MLKKIIIIAVLILVAATFLYVIYGTDLFISTPQNGEIPKQIGSTITEPRNSDTAVGTEVNNLQKILPLSTPSFTISSYNYAEGKFAVELGSDPSNTATSFFDWQKTSAYSAIPKDMFYFK